MVRDVLGKGFWGWGRRGGLGRKGFLGRVFMMGMPRFWQVMGWRGGDVLRRELRGDGRVG